MPEKIFLVSDLSSQGERLDLFVSDRMKFLSRAQVQKLIQCGRVLINGESRKPSSKLNVGDRIVMEYDHPEEGPLPAENIPLKVYYSDSDVAVLEKPTGLVIHPGAGRRHGTLANALLDRFPQVRGVGPEDRPGIVHRLDKETSGLIVVALSLPAIGELKRQFKAREVKKTYQALVWGHLAEREGRWTWPIGRHVKRGERMSTRRTRRPRRAETEYEVRKTWSEYSLLEVKPITGRTHQIRVHLAAAGHPVVGDTRYGRTKVVTGCPRLFLHASRLAFVHPGLKIPLEFESPLAEDLQIFLDTLNLEKS